jgi:hypothetical protein
MSEDPKPRNDSALAGSGERTHKEAQSSVVPSTQRSATGDPDRSGVKDARQAPPPSLTPPPTQKPKSTRRRAKPGQLPAWASKVAASIGVLVLLLLVVFYFEPPTPRQQPIVVLFVSLGMALCFAFVGGRVALTFKIPFLPNNPLSGAAAGGIGAFLLTLVVSKWLFEKPATPEAAARWPPQPFALRVFPTGPGETPSPIIDFRHDREAEYIAYQKEVGYYVIRDVILPQPDVRYEALFRPVAPDTELLAPERKAHVVTDRVTKLCFIPRSKRQFNGEEAFLALACAADKGCTLQADPGWVSGCSPTARLAWPSLLPSAYAADTDNPGRYWVGTSIQTLLKRHDDPNDDPPFMRFNLTGRTSARAATAPALYTVDIRVNGVPVYVDGWRPSETIRGVDKDGKFGLEFALQNLDFSGADGGFEDLSLALEWLDESKHSLGKGEVRRKLVAFRDMPAQESVLENATVSLEGESVPSARLDRFSVMLESTDDLAGANRVKALVDASRQQVGEQALRGVVRPPLTPWRLQQYSNPHYSVLLGVERPTGQLAFAFDEEEANRICRHVFATRSAFKGAVNETVLRYEWPSPGKHPDRSWNPYKPCRDLGSE